MPEGVEPVRIPCKGLSEMLADNDFDGLDCMKIDIEGHEDEALFPFYENSPENLWPSLVVIEHVCAENWQRDCIDLLRSCNYRAIWRGKLNTVFERG
jgi:hypothetical protein